MKYEQYIISKGGRDLGISWFDIENYILTPEQYGLFCSYMHGQTMGVLGDLGGQHISIVYTSDLVRFLKGLPVID